MPYKDKEFHKEYLKGRYRANVQWVHNYKIQNGCTDCGYNEHHAGLEFDHVSGNKVVNVSAAMSRSLPFLMVEIDKCEVVCGTCHNIRTWNRKEQDRLV